MKLKVIQLFLFIFIINGLSAQNFVGKWKASQRGTSYFLEINKDSTFLLIKEKDTLIGNAMVYQDSITTSKIIIDTTTVPRQLDLLMLGNNNKEKITVFSYLGIYEFLSADRVRIRFNFGQTDRPVGFFPKGNLETLIFVKAL
jgi:uncharacterized protein (TIGR03067 family)